METGCLLDVVPPDARLGTLAGLARVCRKKNLQRAAQVIPPRNSQFLGNSIINGDLGNPFQPHSGAGGGRQFRMTETFGNSFKLTHRREEINGTENAEGII